IRRHKTVLGNGEQYLVRVVPRMAARVVRRCGKTPVGELLAPVRLTFKVGAVAGRALLAVELLAERQVGFRVAAREQGKCEGDQALHATRTKAAIPVA